MNSSAPNRFPDPPRQASWKGSELFQREDWELRLEAEDVQELSSTARASASLAFEDLNKSNFRLPRLEKRLAVVQHALEHGSGATRIIGFPADELDPSLLARVFRGLAAHIGTPVSQSAKGERLLHVRDEAFGEGDPRVRGPHTSKRLSFHTDRCDVIAFFCVRAARAGGENDLISSATLYRELRQHAPDALRVLHEPFPYLRHTVDSGNERLFTLQPIFSWHAGHFAASFLRVLIDRADRAPHAPSLSAEQRSALDTLERVAEDPGLYARFRLAAGDMLFVNNWVTFHRRTAFEDYAEPARRRHLMRLWLSVPNSRPLDPRFAASFGETAAGSIRGGMRALDR